MPNRPTQHLSWALAFLCVAVAVSPLGADDVRLRSGDTLSGTVAGSSFMVETDQGLLEVPKSSISKIVVDGTRARFELVDGSTLEGTLESPTIQLDRDLFSRHLEIADIESISLDAPRVSVPSGIPVPLVLATRLGSGGSQSGQEVVLCAAEPVTIDGHTVIEKRAPAVGTVLGAASRSNLRGGGLLSFRVDGIAATDGSGIPIGGTVDQEAGVDAGAILQGGVFGLAAGGNVSYLNAGHLVEATTEAPAEVSLDAAPPEDPRLLAATDQCREAFALLDAGEYIPAEIIRPGGSYIPPPQPLKISVPLDDLLAREGEDARHTESFRTVIVDDTAIQLLHVDSKWKRKGTLRLDLEALIHVRPSHDKRVNLEFEIVAGSHVVGRGALRNIDAEEDKSKNVKTRFEISAEGVEALQRVERPELRVTMTVLQG